MTDHANELRRYSRKIGHPAGDVPSVMLAAADEIERLAAKLEEAESDALEQARLNGMGSEREAALMAKLEAAEKSDAESIAMYRKVRDERDALRVELNEIRYGVAVAHDTIKALRAKIEAAEKERDALRVENETLAANLRGKHSTAGATYAHLIAERDALRAKIEHMEKQAPAAEVESWTNGSYSRNYKLRWLKDVAEGDRLYALPGAQTQPAPSAPEGWKPIPEKHPTFDLVDLKLADGSVLCGCVPQRDGDYWWKGTSREVFIDPKYAPVTHWRLAAAQEVKP